MLTVGNATNQLPTGYMPGTIFTVPTTATLSGQNSYTGGTLVQNGTNAH